MRTLTGSEFLLTIYVDSLLGNPADPDGDVNYVIRDGDGDEVGSGTAEREERGVYTVTVATLDRPDLLDVEVTYEFDGYERRESRTIEVVGSRLVPRWLMHEVIDEDREEQAFSPIAEDDLDRIMAEVEDTFTSALGFPPFERPMRATVESRGGQRLRVPGVAYPLSVYAAEYGDGEAVEDAYAERFHLARPGRAHWPRGLIDLHLSHGLSRVPADLVRAGYYYGRELSRKSAHPARATEVATEGAVFSLATPGAATPTGVPEVDGVLIRHRLRV